MIDPLSLTTRTLTLTLHVSFKNLAFDDYLITERHTSQTKNKGRTRFAIFFVKVAEK